MKKQLLALNHVPKQAIFLLSLFLLAACTFSLPDVTNASLANDTTGCLASQHQIFLRDCLTAVYNARLVNAYTLGQLQ